MRPTFIARAQAATAALGALGLTAIVAAPASSADHATGTAASSGIVRGQSRLNVLPGRRATVTGRLTAAVAGRPVALQRRGRSRWVTVARSTTRAGGRFVIRFRPARPGSFALRLATGGARRGLGRLNVYRRAAVSWYGPGLYGNKLSCGGTLTPGTLGVAHRTLPCGTHVTLRRGDRVVRVPVVDRGPFVGGREFDLTAATRARLGFGDAGSVLVAE